MKFDIKEKVHEAFDAGIHKATSNLSEMMIAEQSFTRSESQVDTIKQNQDFDGSIARDSEAYSIEFHDEKGNSGEATLIFSQEDAYNLISAVTGEDYDALNEEERIDILSEISNIVINACIEQLAPPFELHLTGGVPRQIRDFSQLPVTQSSEAFFKLHSIFKSDSQEVGGEVAIYLPARLFGLT